MGQNVSSRSISRISLIILILFCSSSFELNTDSESETREASITRNGRDPLCRQVRKIRFNLLNILPTYFKDADPQCDIDQNDGCKSTNCVFNNKENISGGYQLLLCDSKPTVQFWIDSPKWTEKWSHNFTVQNESQRVEVVQSYNDSSILSRQRVYLTVRLNLSQSKLRDQTLPHLFLNFSASYEIWSRNPEKLASQNIIINTTHFSLNQLCSDSSPPQNLLQRQPLTVDEMHSNLKRTSIESSRIGKACDPRNIFECGSGATCVAQTPTTGICECMKDFALAENGTCISIITPTNPTEPPPSDNSTHSPALGVFLSIVALIGIAAAIFFGARYRMLSRIRNRMFSSWPFRRDASTFNDQVVMVDPFANDDEPPLL